MQLSVAVVDDDASYRTALRRVLTAHGLSLSTFASGPQLFASILAGDRPDCLILDVQMPEMTGLDVQAWLRDRGFNIPAIMLTGRTDEQTEARSKALGAAAYLSKPMDARALIDAIDFALGQ